MGLNSPASSSTKSLPNSITTTPQQSTHSLAPTTSLLNLPTKPTTPTTTQSLTNLPSIDTSKPYISAALRHLSTPTAKASALAGLSAWREKFSSEEFQETLQKIEVFKNEDHMRELPRARKHTLVRRNAVKRGPMDEMVWLRRRVRVSDEGEPLGLRTWPSNTSSAKTVVSDGDGTRGDEATGDGTTRARWDIRECGPVSPLSPTSTIGNAFSEGGFWDEKTETEVASTVTLVRSNEDGDGDEEEDAAFPSSSYKPTDLDNRDIFTTLKRAIHDATLTHCATRLGKPSLLSPDALIHPSLIKKSDEIAAAEEILAAKANALATSCPPADDIVTADVNEKIKPFLSTEATVIQDYSIADAAELENMDAWLSVDDKRYTIATKLDTQLSLLRANWARAREEGVLRSPLPLAARELAWAVKLFVDITSSEDLIFFSNTDEEEEEEVDDEGYSYQNFLHHLRSEANLPADEVPAPWPEEMEKLRPKIVPWTEITGDDSGEEGGEEEDEGESETSTPRTTILFGSPGGVEGEEKEKEEESPKGEKRARRRAPALGELESWAVEARGWEDDGEMEGEGEEKIGVAL